MHIEFSKRVRFPLAALQKDNPAGINFLPGYFLSLLIDWCNALLADIVRLILIFRLYLLRHTVKFIATFLLFHSLFLTIVHINSPSITLLITCPIPLRLYTRHLPPNRFHMLLSPLSLYFPLTHVYISPLLRTLFLKGWCEMSEKKVTSIPTDVYDDGNIPDVDLPQDNAKAVSKSKYEVEPLPESSRPRKDGPGGA